RPGATPVRHRAGDVPDGAQLAGGHQVSVDGFGLHLRTMEGRRTSLSSTHGEGRPRTATPCPESFLTPRPVHAHNVKGVIVCERERSISSPAVAKRTQM